MTDILRVVPILTVHDVDAACDRYTNILGFAEVMNHGWIVTLADASGSRQISLMTKDQTACVNPHVSIEVTDIDAAYSSALNDGAQIVHELQDEPWGVRRFFFRDSSGNVVNVLSHRR